MMQEHKKRLQEALKNTDDSKIHRSIAKGNPWVFF